MSLFEKGLIHVYTGNGKGKTTAAMGLIVRSVGHGGKVAMVQFMKGWPFYGEIKGLNYLPGVELFRTGGEKCFRKGEHTEKDVREAQRGLEISRKCVVDPKYDLVVLDEINVAVNFGLLALSDVLNLISIKLPTIELVLTGRYAPNELIEVADLVTEMVEVKHPYQKDIMARKGIEY